MESLSKERLWDSGIIWGPWELKEGNRQEKVEAISLGK